MMTEARAGFRAFNEGTKQTGRGDRLHRLCGSALAGPMPVVR